MLDFLTDISTPQKIGKVYLKQVKINKPDDSPKKATTAYITKTRKFKF